MVARVGKYVIRDIQPWEGPGLFAMTGNADVMRYMGFAKHDTVEQAEKLVQLYREAPSRFQAICLADTPNDILAVIGLEVRGHQATVTVMSRRDWKARGVGRGFCKPFVQWIFTHPKIWRVWSYCHVDNIAVQRVLERMGAEREGTLRRFEYFPNVSEVPQDVYVYSIVRG